MAKRGIIARLLGLPAGLAPQATLAPQAILAPPAAPKTPKPSAAGSGGRPVTVERKAIIEEAMRVHGKIRAELGEEEIEKMAKAITHAKIP